MNKFYSSKAEVCYKDICAKFYGENASIIKTVVVAVIIVVGASIAIKHLS